MPSVVLHVYYILYTAAYIYYDIIHFVSLKYV